MHLRLIQQLGVTFALATLVGCAEVDEPFTGRDAGRDARADGEAQMDGEVTADGAVVGEDGAVIPTGPEECDTGRDEDGDGLVDEDCPCFPGMSQACSAAPGMLGGNGACNFGTQQCDGAGELGVWGTCEGAGSPSEELCDGADNNCDGQIDEGCECAMGMRRPCYPGPAGTQDVGACRAGEQECALDDTGHPSWGACEGAVTPTGDRCDGLDNNCDGRNDEVCTCPVGTSRDCYSGRAGTAGVGLCRGGRQVCVPGRNGTTREVEGSLWGTCTGEMVPGGELCDDRMDNDCDGTVDCLDTDCRGVSSCTTCAPGGERIDLVTDPVEVLFVVDRSSSMIIGTPGGPSRWEALRMAVDRVLPTIDRTHHMGLFIFPFGGSCAVTSAPQVPITMPAAARISSALASGGPNGNTPTTEALTSAEAYLRSTPSSRRRVIVLATDGAPNCSGTLATTLTELSGIRSRLRIDTFVLGIPGGDPSLRNALNQMADSGGRPRTGATRFYEAGTGPEFEVALRTIAASAGSCVYRLATRPTDPMRMTVSFDGRVVPRDATNGWEYTDGTYMTIRFNGTSCMTLQSGTVSTINAGFGC